MHLDETVRYLIGAGAAAAAQCEGCLEVCVALARQCGAEERDIRTAIAIGHRVMRCAARSAEGAAGSEGQSGSAQNGSDACCGSMDIRSKEGRSQ